MKSLFAFFAIGMPLAAAQAEPVEVTAEPYLWAPTITGTISLGPLTVPLDVGPEQLATGVRAGVMGYAKVRKGDAFVATEVIAADFRRDKFAPLLGQNVAAKIASIEGEAGYQIVSSTRMTVSPFVGIRYNYLKARAGTAPARIAVLGEWIEPLIGLNGAARLADRWHAHFKINHGLGVTTQRSFDVRGDIDYRISTRFSVFAGWRHSDHFYRNSGGTPFGLDLHGDGPLLGARTVLGATRHGNLIDKGPFQRP